MKKIVLLLLLCISVGACTPKPEVKLDENQAIQIGSAFLKAVMQGTYAEAYEQYMSPSLKFTPQTDQKQFSADWSAIIEKYGDLQKAVFDAYQLVPGRRVIQLYYQVTHAKLSEPVVYHLVLEQDLKGRFTVFIVDIGNEKIFPPGVKQPTEKFKKEGVPDITPQ